MILTLTLVLLFLLEILEILCVPFVLWRLFVFGQLLSIPVLGLSCPALILPPLYLRDALPVFADNLGELGKGERLTFQVLADLWKGMSESRKNMPPSLDQSHRCIASSAARNEILTVREQNIC